MTPRISFDCRFRYSSGFTLDAAFETDGEVTALYGPSGSGKTTILSLIAGLLRPDEGLIRIGDDVVTDTQNAAFVRPERRRVGMLMQDHCLFPHLRVKANIAYGASRRNVGGAEIARIVEILELSDLLNRYPQELSGGQQHRVALARALASAPRVLLLDEPLTAVEASLQERIASFIDRVVAELRVPAIIVSHNRDLVDRLASRVIHVRHGGCAAGESTRDG